MHGIPSLHCPSLVGPSCTRKTKGALLRVPGRADGAPSDTGGEGGDGGMYEKGGLLLGSLYGPRRRRAKEVLSLNPLGTGAKFWLSASNIGRGGGGGGGGSKGGAPPLVLRCTALLIHPWSPLCSTKQFVPPPLPPPLKQVPGEGVQGGAPPPRAGTYPIHREQKNYWRINNSAHGNVVLSAVSKGNSSLNVNSGFPHVTNTQQLQQSGTFII